MRARLTAIVLSLMVGFGLLILGAGASSAATPTPDVASLGATAPQQVVHALPRAERQPSATGGSTPDQQIRGTLQAAIGEKGAREPIADVVISVDQDGRTIGTDKSDAKGQWSVPVPQGGTYSVTIDIKSLPKTVQLSSTARETLSSVVVGSGQTKFAIFALVPAGQGGSQSTGSGSGDGNLQYAISIIIAGLRYGLIIAMTAVGLSLIFGTTGLINFAHGELVTLGAVIAYIFGTSPLHWSFAIAVILAIVGVAGLGGLMELSLWRPLRKRGTGLIQMFIISIGLSLLIRHIILYFFGSSRNQLAQATVQTPLTFGPVVIAPRDLVLIILSIAVLVAVALMLQKTRMGKAMRALADNRDLAEASGINVQRVTLQVWLLGGGLAAVGGVFFGLTTAVYWNMGWYLLLLMFAGVILGGLGSAYGAMLGSIVVGLVAQGSTVWFPPDLQNAWAMLVLVVVLLIRPQGILGRLQRAG